MAGADAADRAAAQAEILLVEDSPGDARLLAEAFREAPLQPSIRTFGDSQAAWQEVQRILGDPTHPRPQLMLLDLGLPGSSGLELLSRIRRSAPGVDWPMAILTSSLSDADIREAGRLHAAGYFVKPATLDGYVQLAQHLTQRWLAAPAAAKHA